MKRRDVLKLGLTGLSVAAMGGIKLPGLVGVAQAQTQLIYRLSITECLLEMVDESRVYTWAYADQDGPRYPGPVIVGREGESVFIELTNELSQPHAFSIPGVVNLVVRPGQRRSVRFVAPRAGTYLYQDTMNAPINRMMGLHGVLISLPRVGSNIPFSNSTPMVTQLFADLGVNTNFPGEPWGPEGTTVWVFHEIDPGLNERVRRGEVTNGEDFGRQFRPRYFLLNGRSGYFAAHAEDTILRGPIGRPRMIRIVNGGLWHHSLHTHGNHGYIVALDGEPQENVFLLDVWTVKPAARVDVLWPFVKPPDIPDAVWQRFLDGTSEEGFPLEYPVHCHVEMSQTAGGSNYPHGLMTHIQFTGVVGHEAS